MTRTKLPEGFTADDYEISATVRDLDRLNKMIELLERLPAGRRPKSLLDMGCGIGGLTQYVASRLGIEEPIGVDIDRERLERAAGRGVKVIEANLNHEPLPVADASIGLVVSFGVFEHLVFYDNTVSEAARVLEDGGWFLLSMPNLASYINRAALLLGYQPREVEISKEVSAGLPPPYRRYSSKGLPLGHVHAATLRSMRELLHHFEFNVVRAAGFSPDFGSRLIRILDKAFGNIPSLSRRFIILAERRSRTGK